MNFLMKPSQESMIAAESVPQMGRSVQEPMDQGALPPMPQYSAQELDRLNAMARAEGYQNYEQMRAFLLRRQMQTGGTVPGQQQGRAPAGVDTAMSIHPRNLLNYTLDKFKKATGQ